MLMSYHQVMKRYQHFQMNRKSFPRNFINCPYLKIGEEQSLVIIDSKSIKKCRLLKIWGNLELVKMHHLFCTWFSRSWVGILIIYAKNVGVNWSITSFASTSSSLKTQLHLRAMFAFFLHEECHFWKFIIIRFLQEFAEIVKLLNYQYLLTESI